jgi:hypothetical protein
MKGIKSFCGPFFECVPGLIMRVHPIGIIGERKFVIAFPNPERIISYSKGDAEPQKEKRY